MDSKRLGRRGVLAGGLASTWAGLAPRAAPVPAEQNLIIPVLEDIDILGPSLAEQAACHAPFRAELSAWLEEAYGRFVRPVAMVVNGPTSTSLHVPGLHPALDISLDDGGEINVWVNWRDVCWDILVSMDVWLKAEQAGWLNVLYVPEAQVLHTSLEAGWRADGFEPLLRWLNEDLAPATHLALYGSGDGGWTAADLVRDGRFQRTGKPIDGFEWLRHLLPLHAAA